MESATPPPVAGRMYECGSPTVRIHPEAEEADLVDQRIWNYSSTVTKKEACELCAKTLSLKKGYVCAEEKGEYYLRGCKKMQACVLPLVHSPPIPAPPPGVCRSHCDTKDACKGEDPAMISAFCDQFKSKVQCDSPEAHQRHTEGEAYCKWLPKGGVAPLDTKLILNGQPCPQLKRTKCE